MSKPPNIISDYLENHKNEDITKAVRRSWKRWFLTLNSFITKWKRKEIYK